MKKIYTILSLLLSIAFLSGNAQTTQTNDFSKKGMKMLNPQLLNVGYTKMGFKVPGSDEDETTDFKQFGVVLAGGYAIEDGLFVTGQVGTQKISFGETDFSFASIGGGIRYYLPLNVFAGGGLLLNTGKLKGYEEDDLSTTLVDYRLELGYAYFLIPGVALEPSFSYGGKILGGKLEGYDHKIGYDRLGINLGVSVFF